MYSRRKEEAIALHKEYSKWRAFSVFSKFLGGLTAGWITSRFIEAYLLNRPILLIEPSKPVSLIEAGFFGFVAALNGITAIQEWRYEQKIRDARIYE